jgi:N-acetylglucosaminyldiphosphoundecaprenol N-acetyl-beta-D-mannosaminyltransferase
LESVESRTSEGSISSDIERRAAFAGEPLKAHPDIMNTESTIDWPAKYDLFGVKATATCYDEAVAVIIRAALRGVPGVVDLMSAHGLVAGARDAKFREVLNSFEIVASDGQPVRWALNFFHKTGLKDRVYGPELTIRL